MLWLSRFTPRTVKRAPAALALTLIAAVACADRVPTAPLRTATQRASRDISPGIDDLWISPYRRVTAGESPTGTISLKTPAPPGGLPVVIIMAHHSNYVIPDTTRLVVPENATSQTFTIQTLQEPDTLGVMFDAYLATGQTISGQGFTLYPGAPPPPPPVRSISVSPDTLRFGPQAPGTSSTPQVARVTNTGNVNILIGSIYGTVSATGPFSITNTCQAVLVPKDSCVVWVVYAPTTSAAPQSGLLTIPSSAPSSPNEVTLIGTPTSWINVTPMAMGFGSVALGNATSGRVVKITNTGTASFVVSSLTTGGANPGDFPIYSDGCTGATLSPGSSCTAYVSFEPLGLGTRTATITIANNAANGPVTVSLTGTGVKGSGGYVP
jgi:hypothetical protein